jgi:hypothetical protein
VSVQICEAESCKRRARDQALSAKTGRRGPSTKNFVNTKRNVLCEITLFEELIFLGLSLISCGCFRPFLPAVPPTRRAGDWCTRTRPLDRTMARGASPLMATKMRLGKNRE